MRVTHGARRSVRSATGRYPLLLVMLLCTAVLYKPEANFFFSQIGRIQCRWRTVMSETLVTARHPGSADGHRIGKSARRLLLSHPSHCHARETGISFLSFLAGIHFPPWAMTHSDGMASYLSLRMSPPVTWSGVLDPYLGYYIKCRLAATPTQDGKRYGKRYGKLSRGHSSSES